MMVKRALLIHNNKFLDKSFQPLLATSEDVQRLTELLKKDYVGFDDKNVIVKSNLNLEDFRDEVSRFFGNADKEDFLFFYYAGHGIRGDSGELFLALKGTTNENYDAVSLNASYIREKLERSFSEKKVVMLDCCNAGAFRDDGSFTARSADFSGGLLNAAFDPKGTGTYVLGASQSGASAYETVDETGKPYSLFTDAFIRGVESGEAAPGKATINLIDISGYIHSQRNKDGKETRPYLDVTNSAGYLEFSRNPNPDAEAVQGLSDLMSLQSAAQKKYSKLSVLTKTVIGIVILFLLGLILILLIYNPRQPTQTFDSKEVFQDGYAIANAELSGYAWTFNGPSRTHSGIGVFGCQANSSVSYLRKLIFGRENCDHYGSVDLDNRSRTDLGPDAKFRNASNLDAVATSCRSYLPLLCIDKSGNWSMPEGLERDEGNNLIVGVKDPRPFWTSGVVMATLPLLPPAHITDADKICQESFGANYKVAGIRDGFSAHSLYAYLYDPKKPPEPWGWRTRMVKLLSMSMENPHFLRNLKYPQKFWLDIENQPYANCWNRS